MQLTANSCLFKCKFVVKKYNKCEHTGVNLIAATREIHNTGVVFVLPSYRGCGVARLLGQRALEDVTRRNPNALLFGHAGGEQKIQININISDIQHKMMAGFFFLFGIKNIIFFLLAEISQWYKKAFGMDKFTPWKLMTFKFGRRQ